VKQQVKGLIAGCGGRVLDHLSSICHRAWPSPGGSRRYRAIVIDTDVVLESWLL
jgi:hypothetical protein